MNKKQRLVAIVLALSFLCIILSSAIFVLHNADHDCIGEDCEICAQIAYCNNIVKVLSLVILAVYIASVAFKLRLKIFKSTKIIVYNTIVSDKVKLLN